MSGQSAYTVRETAGYYAWKVKALQDRISQDAYRRSLADVVMLESVAAFLDRVNRDDLSVFRGEQP